MPSFDVVSELDQHELTNAVDQASRDLGNRFDFKGTDANFELKEYVVTMEAPSDFQLKQMLDILTPKITGRGIPASAMSPEDPDVNLARARQNIIMKHGIDKDAAREIVKIIKGSKLKVQAAIQGEQVRITGKKRDLLQDAIQLLKDAKLDLPLQFNNFRD
jgi:uncharacterized protein YajQ (UPF0234 family)